jgi:hypothetical protein
MQEFVYFQLVIFHDRLHLIEPAILMPVTALVKISVTSEEHDEQPCCDPWSDPPPMSRSDWSALGRDCLRGAFALKAHNHA